MRRLVSLFSPGFVVMASPFEGSISDTQQLAGVVAAYRASVSQLRLVEGRRSLEIDSARGTALMALTIDAITVDGMRPGRQTYRFRIGWVRENGEWWIHEVELLEVDTGGGALA